MYAIEALGLRKGFKNKGKEAEAWTQAVDGIDLCVEEGDIVEMLAMGDFLERFSSQLSSGQRTLVGLAKALLSEPRLLVLDEPTASLDPEVSERVRKVIRDEHASRSFTLLVTSHNMADIE